MKLKIEHGFHYRHHIETILNGNIKKKNYTTKFYSGLIVQVKTFSLYT